jgi:hypothetical protein
MDRFQDGNGRLTTATILPGPDTTSKVTLCVADGTSRPAASTISARSRPVSWPSSTSASPVPVAAEGTSTDKRTAVGAEAVTTVCDAATAPAAVYPTAVRLPGLKGKLHSALGVTTTARSQVKRALGSRNERMGGAAIAHAPHVACDILPAEAPAVHEQLDGGARAVDLDGVEQRAVLRVPGARSVAQGGFVQLSKRERERERFCQLSGALAVAGSPLARRELVVLHDVHGVARRQRGAVGCLGVNPGQPERAVPAPSRNYGDPISKP